VRDAAAGVIQKVAPRFDRILLDTGAGISDVVLYAVSLADEVVVVATPEPTSLTDAYATIKVLAATSSGARSDWLVNQTTRHGEGRAIRAQLQQVVDRFVTTAPTRRRSSTRRRRAERHRGARVGAMRRQLLHDMPGLPAAGRGRDDRRTSGGVSSRRSRGVSSRRKPGPTSLAAHPMSPAKPGSTRRPLPQVVPAFAGMTVFVTDMDDDTPPRPDPLRIPCGEPVVLALVQRFYDLMDLEPSYGQLRALHPAHLEGSRDKLFWFLCGWLGGPQHYVERFGHPRLRARAPAVVDRHRRARPVLACMQQAMQETGIAPAFAERLAGSFFNTADWMRNRGGVTRLSSRRRPGSTWGQRASRGSRPSPG
jgi:hemoglobin